ncbi:MAG: hypothetical protein [Circular genetic element sp.]|nr:MAG: hypothetical protein [Circular genetic element sp.]
MLRFLQCFLFFLRGFLPGRSKPCIVNCPERRITSRPDGIRVTRREEIRPSGVILIAGLLTISRKSSTEICFIPSSSFLFASSDNALASSRRSRSSSASASLRSSSKSRKSKRISRSKSLRSVGPKNSGKSSRSYNPVLTN